MIRAEEIEPSLRHILDADRCAAVHVDVNPVKHMWAPGQMQFKEMHLEPAGE